MYQNSSNPYCTNCGRVGHSIKRCNDPVVSLGIMAFKFEKDEPKLIMIQRRNSMSYVEFLRGKYNKHNLEYVLTLINGMTNIEIEDLQTKNFETLWKELWVNNDNKLYKNDYYSSKDRCESLDLATLIGKKTQFHITPEWGFPKGRRNYRERDIDCAMREFNEETGVDESSLNILQNVIPIREDFIGNNNVKYRHIYYLSKVRESCKNIPLTINEDNPEQYAEIGDIKWLGEEEAIEHMRDDDVERKKIIRNVCLFLKKLNSNFYLKKIKLKI